MHFGCICDNGPSHVMSAAAIGRGLLKRGHDFTLFGFPHLRPWIEKEGIPVSYLPDSPEFAERLKAFGEGRSFSKRGIIGALAQDALFLLRELPGTMQHARVECVVVDANLPAGASVAESQSLPFVTFCNALPPHEEPAIPPGFLPWAYSPGMGARLQNRTAYLIRDLLIGPLKRVLNSFRHQHALQPYRKLSDAFSQLAQITQLVAEFDFPRTRLPRCFHYVGPYFRHTASDIPFPFERLDGRPLVYASLGTILEVESRVWNSIAQACAPLGVQLAIASPRTPPGLPGDPVVVPYAPQEALLARAAVFITHAGLNSALEGLAHGVPMLALPFLADQMGVASRIEYRGVGLFQNPKNRRPEILAAALTELLNNGGYRERSQAVAKVIQASGGAALAAEIIERAALTEQPVLRETGADPR